MAKKQVFLIKVHQYGTDGTKTKVMPVLGRKKAGEAMATLLVAAETSGHYISPVHYTDWGRYKCYNRLTVDSFHASHANGTETSVELITAADGKIIDF